jgi:hypothetical protein
MTAHVNWLGFIASLIKSLAWPIAVALIIWWLRDPIRRRIAHLRRARVAGQEFEFAEVVDDAEAAASEAPLPPVEPETGEPALSTELASEIATAPRAAVVEAWLAVERELRTLASLVGISRGYHRPQSLAHNLAGRGVIDPALPPVVEQLKHARDLAAHSRPYDVAKDEVVEYVKLAGRVRSALRIAAQTYIGAERGETGYDLLVYHDLSDPTGTTGGTIPSVGESGDRFADIGKDRYVVAVGPGIHPGRVTVVLAHSHRPMPEIQEMLNRIAE